MRRLLLPALLAAAAPALAATPSLDLPAGTLGQAITRLGAAAGVSIAVDDPGLWRRPVGAVRGRIGVQTALGRLARQAGGAVVPAGPKAWRIVPGRLRIAPPRPAPIPPSAGPEPDIVVTASKRDMRLRDYAGQVAMIPGADLTTGGAGGTDAILSRLATLSSTHLGAGRNKLFIRGIADSSFTGPTQATVGQYFGDLRLAYNAPDPDLRLYDMGGVEVLEGPQGTLYGAGSLGGIVRLDPAVPVPGAIAGSATLGGSLTAHGRPGGDAAGMLNLPLVDERATLRLIGYGVSEGGYIDNPLTGANDVNRIGVWGGRATMRLEAGDGWTIDLGGVGQWTNGDDSQYADRDGPRLTRASAVAQGFDARYLLGQIVIDKAWDELRFRSTTGLIGQRLTERYDAGVPMGEVLPGTGAPDAPLSAATRVSEGQPRLFVQRNATRLFASESRLWRPMRDGVGWIAGASLVLNRTRLDRAIGPVGAPLPVTGVTNRIGELTLYGEGSVQPLPRLTITAGGRISRARLSGAGEDVSALIAQARAGTTATRHATSVLPSAAITAEVLPRTSLYLRYQQGFRPGGLAIEGDFVRRFDDDRVTTMESGMRLTGPVDAVASLSYTRWSDIQADFIDASGLPSTANIGDGRIWTVSTSAGWRPVPPLRLDLAFTYNSSRVSDPAPALLLALGRMSRVPNVARYAARAGFDYRATLDGDISLRLSGWARYVGRSRLGIGPVLGEAQGDYLDTAVHARVGRPSLGVSVGLTNLIDAIGNRFALGTPFPTGRGQITPLRPRTLRIGLDANF
jgi:outer membrane receptor protein involved in Fe transport